MKYRLEDLKIGMNVNKEELKEIKYVWMLVKYENESDKYGTLIYFEKDNPDRNYSFDIREKIATYIFNTKINEDGSYAEFWGVYINIDKDVPFDMLECYHNQVFTTVVIPKGKWNIMVDTSFGKMVTEEAW